jgi:hypothetical protein
MGVKLMDLKGAEKLQGIAPVVANEDDDVVEGEGEAAPATE